MQVRKCEHINNSNAFLCHRLTEHVINHNDFVAFHHELIDQMTTDESGTTGNKNLHPLCIRNLSSLHNVGGGACGDALTGQNLLIFQEALLGLRHGFLMRLEADDRMLIDRGVMTVHSMQNAPAAEAGHPSCVSK